MKMVTLVAVVAVLCLVVACAPPAPTPTPTLEPVPLPLWIVATEPEHLKGTWFVEAYMADHYFRWDEDGTIWLGDPPNKWGRFWFEEGLYYEERPDLPGIGVYEAHLQIQEGRAVRLRMEVVEDTRDYTTGVFRYPTTRPFVRSD
jgi:hypothetical protein